VVFSLVFHCYVHPAFPRDFGPQHVEKWLPAQKLFLLQYVLIPVHVNGYVWSFHGLIIQQLPSAIIGFWASSSILGPAGRTIIHQREIFVISKFCSLPDHEHRIIATLDSISSSTTHKVISQNIREWLAFMAGYDTAEALHIQDLQVTVSVLCSLWLMPAY